ncbi:MAG: nucleotidyltransferase domain-containing protein [Acidimicrobiia bacterium]|jgi:predicted nucleotidyltransferase|nr:nucleotidyltransferase domain-containing protein [Acidimicrobiia bacterium]
MSKTTPAAALGTLRRMADSGDLDPFCRDQGVQLLVAFGSTADPLLAEHARDLDLAASFDASGDGDPVQLINALVDVLHIDEIDVMDLDRAGPVAREQALVGTVGLYEKEAGILIGMRDVAMLRRMDTGWFRQLDLRLMAAG